MADGKVTISTELDNKKLEGDLSRLTRKIETLEDRLSRQRSERSPLVEQSAQLSVNLDKAGATLERMKSGGEFFTSGAIREQEAIVQRLQKEWDTVQSRVEKYDANIRNTAAELDRQKEKAGGIAQQLAKASKSSDKMAKAQERAQKSAHKFSLRLREVIRSALVFTLITQALGKFREWMGKVIRTNQEAAAAMARLKGALLTMVQPLLNIIIPAFVALVNILTRVISVIAQIFAMLSGKTIDSSKKSAAALNKETEALEGVGSAAKEARSQLAGFDEINQLSGDNSGGGGGSSGPVAPDFDFDADLTDSQLKNILGLVEMIAAGILAWKLGNGFLDSLGKFAGLLLAINGGIGLAQAAMDAWTNGVSWENLLEMLARAAELVLGLWIAFGKVGAGIGLVISGLTMLATGFHDAFENGWNLQNTLLSMAGLFATGLGIALLTGSWIPALIGGIAAVLLAFTVATGHGEELLAGVRTMMEGFVDFFTGVFTGDIEKAIGGIGKIFDGLGVVVGALIDGLRDTLLGFLDWLDEKTGGKLHNIIEFAKKIVAGFFDTPKEAYQGFIDGMKLAFQGVIQFLTGVFTGDWEMAWEGVKNIFKGAWNGIISLVEGAINLLINGINALINGFNKVLSMGDAVAEKLFGTTVRVPTISDVSIPRLASGAVVPPNREFMAVLGDNKKETEIVSPLSTMKQALMEAMQEVGGGGNNRTIQVNLVVDGKTLARVVVPQINDMTKQAGKPVLLF